MGLESYLYEPSSRRTLWLGKGHGVFIAGYLAVGRPDDYRGMVDVAKANDVRALCRAMVSDWSDRVRDGIAEGENDGSFAVKVAAFVACGERIEIRNDHQNYEDEEEPKFTDARKIVLSWYAGEILDPDPKADRMAEEIRRFESALALDRRSISDQRSTRSGTESVAS